MLDGNLIDRIAFNFERERRKKGGVERKRKREREIKFLMDCK